MWRRGEFARILAGPLRCASAVLVLSRTGRGRAASAFPVKTYLLPKRFNSTKAPKIRGFGIVVRIGVEAVVGRNELVELMNDQEDGIELARVSHEGVERDVGIISA